MVAAGRRYLLKLESCPHHTICGLRGMLVGRSQCLKLPSRVDDLS
jgi:hypothetical protein